jgi:uncharacterized protein YacL
MIWQIFVAIIFVLFLAYSIFARRSLSISASVFSMTLLGVITGLSVGALISIPLASLPAPFGQWLPIIVNIFMVAVVTTFFYNQRDNLAKSFNHIVGLVTDFVKASSRLKKDDGEGVKMSGVVVDTSVVIDGRVLDLVKTGFLSGRLIVPRFVLNELQMVADSEDALKRGKGRRGLEILNDLRKTKGVKVDVVVDDFEKESDVDSKMILLAKRYKSPLLTVDYNLNRVAQIQNVSVLNINELNNALRPVVLPGEKFAIKVVQSGKDETQGVGYLEDGTMVVVEGGNRYIGKNIDVVVTRVFQTVAGKMIFTTPVGQETPTAR